MYILGTFCNRKAKEKNVKNFNIPMRNFKNMKAFHNKCFQIIDLAMNVKYIKCKDFFLFIFFLKFSFLFIFFLLVLEVQPKRILLKKVSIKPLHFPINDSRGKIIL